VKQKSKVQRAESRVDLVLTVTLIGKRGKLGVEKTITENVSSHGVRVISGNNWPIDEVILISLPAGHFTSPARVAYCEQIGERYFATGLEFVGWSAPLNVSALIWQPGFPENAE
jgi:PilZ domain